MVEEGYVFIHWLIKVTISVASFNWSENKWTVFKECVNSWTKKSSCQHTFSIIKLHVTKAKMFISSKFWLIIYTKTFIGRWKCL